MYFLDQKSVGGQASCSGQKQLQKNFRKNMAVLQNI